MLNPAIIYGTHDILHCTVKFLPKGVMLDIDHIVEPQLVATFKTEKAKNSSLKWNKWLDAEVTKLTTQHANRGSIAKSEISDHVKFPLAKFGYFSPQDHTIRISHERVTVIRFFSGHPAWSFDVLSEGYGFSPKNKADWPRFQNTQPCTAPYTGYSGVETRFVPTPGGAPYQSFAYELRMKTKSLDANGEETGHLIIIIDPVFETGEVSV